MADPTYTCAACRGTFVAGWTNEEAEAEYRTLFPSHQNEPREVVCDDCFKRMTAEYPPEQFERDENQSHD